MSRGRHQPQGEIRAALRRRSMSERATYQYSDHARNRSIESIIPLLALAALTFRQRINDRLTLLPARHMCDGRCERVDRRERKPREPTFLFVLRGSPDQIFDRRTA